MSSLFSPPDDNLAEIGSIIDERGNPAKAGGNKSKAKKKKGKRKGVSVRPHEFKVTWSDGAPPQWVDACYLEDTTALEDWRDAEDEVAEDPDSPDELKAKLSELTGWIGRAKRPVFLLGAGISASVLPTFRGKGGLWTKNAGTYVPPAAPKVGERPEPTRAHRGLVALEQAGHVYWLATQNYDDLSSRSGFPASKLSELHGNIYTETCPKCEQIYHRDFEVELATAKNHETGRTCDVDGCGGKLKDNIVHFEETLPWHELKMANAKFVGADLAVVLGSSLRVEPAASLPFKGKRRSKYGGFDGGRPKSVIVNLQPTRLDDEADLVIRASCDEVVDHLARTMVGAGWDGAAGSKRGGEDVNGAGESGGGGKRRKE